MGVPTLRLRADYLAIVTISIAEVVRLLVRSQTFRNVFGGADGISDFSAAYRDLSPFDPSLGYGLGPFQNDGVMRWLLLVLWLGLAVGRRRRRDASRTACDPVTRACVWRSAVPSSSSRCS